VSVSHSNSSDSVKPKEYFATTRWTMVLKAGGSDSTHARQALEKLCQTYWFPLYAYVRRRGYGPEDAQDLTQGFFARLLEHKSLANADPERGRFRSFILGALNHFLADEHARAHAQKRGGGRPLVSLDLAAAEERFDLEPADEATPDKAFDKQWAAALLNEVLNRLADEYRRDGKAELFAAIKQSLAGSRESQPYAELARRVGMNEGAVRTAVHRLRKRYRELLRSEIGDTVSSEEDVNDEIRHLFKISGGG
jgi:RNA polymerase sigma factor (sigma-70 family)